MLWNKQIKDIRNGVQTTLDSFKDELNDHLDAINQGHDEIQSMYDFLSDIDSKLDKLNERLDQMEMMINPYMEPLATDIQLNSKEKEVFMVLYTNNDKIRVYDIAKQLGYSEDMVLAYIYNLIAKGIPVIKEFLGNDTFVRLNPRFKDLQTRRNVLKFDNRVLI